MERVEREASPGRGSYRALTASHPKRTGPLSADLCGPQFKKHRLAHLSSPLGLSSASMGFRTPSPINTLPGAPVRE